MFHPPICHLVNTVHFYVNQKSAVTLSATQSEEIKERKRAKCSARLRASAPLQSVNLHSQHSSPQIKQRESQL